MVILWTKNALKGLDEIRSKHFSREETKLYKRRLVQEIEKKITLLKTSMPANEPEWNGTFRIVIDKFKVYYSFSEDAKFCYVEAIKHQRQQN